MNGRDIPRSAEELFDPESTKDDDLSALLDHQNAADAPRIKRRGAIDKAQELTDETDLRELLQLPSGAGVRFLARLLEHCNWGGEYFVPTHGVMCYAAGRREVCRAVENWVSDADLELWFAVRRQLEIKRPKPKTSERGRRPARGVSGSARPTS